MNSCFALKVFFKTGLNLGFSTLSLEIPISKVICVYIYTQAHIHTHIYSVATNTSLYIGYLFVIAF